MTTFRYKGQTAGGAKVSGVLRAYDEFEAADKLRESVAIITKLEAVPEKKESVLSRPVAFRVKEKELALLCSQFAIILASGLSVERCVSMVAAQTKNKYLRRMLDKVSEEVGAGYSLAQSFENNAPYLPKTFTETLRAGEQSGTLELCFDRLHKYYDKSAKTHAKLVSTLTYPVLVLCSWSSCCSRCPCSPPPLPSWAATCRPSPGGLSPFPTSSCTTGGCSCS